MKKSNIIIFSLVLTIAVIVGVITHNYIAREKLVIPKTLPILLKAGGEVSGDLQDAWQIAVKQSDEIRSALKNQIFEKKENQFLLIVKYCRIIILQ